MATLKFKAAPPPESDVDDDDDDDRQRGHTRDKRIKLIDREDNEGNHHEETSSSAMRFTGGIVVSLESESNELSTSASLSAAEKKGLKEVEELKRELDLQNTFSEETNRRDEDAEMNKYIEEQIRLKREAAKSARRQSSRQEGQGGGQQSFSEPTALVTAGGGGGGANVDDILLDTLSKNYASKADEKSEAMLSSQMLNGIPEVDLGLSERVRTIEATEEAKLRLVSQPQHHNSRGYHHQHNTRPQQSTAVVNFSCNYKQLRTTRDQHEGELKSSFNHSSRDRNHQQGSQNSDSMAPKTTIEPVVSVGEEPREIELRTAPVHSAGHRPPVKGRASDDYCLQKYKKNTRR